MKDDGWKWFLERAAWISIGIVMVAMGVTGYLIYSLVIWSRDYGGRW